MKILTVQTFAIEYDVPEEEILKFMAMMEEGECICEYEVDQEFLGEQIVGQC